VLNDAAYTPFGEHYDENVGDSGFFAGNVSIWPSFMDGYAATFRLYEFHEGRWVSPDPAGLGAVDVTNPQSWNRYAYVLNNPASHVDPSGTCSQNADGTYSDNGGEPCVDPSGTSVTVSASTDPVDYDTSTDPGASYAVGTFFSSGFGFLGGFMGMGFGTPANAGRASNPCGSANPFTLDYSQMLYKNGTQTTQEHILQNHAPGGKGSSIYSGDWFAIKVLNSSTLMYGGMAPQQFQRSGTYALRWDAPPLPFPLSLLFPDSRIGWGPNKQLTSINQLVVKTNCNTS
jgi:RHS repeat-associated protein